MISLKVMSTVLDLFFQYEWHNFLHNLVKSLVEMVVKGENEAFKRSLFTDADILQRIVDAHHKNEEAMKLPKACRKGYMGQLRLIANMIIQESATDRWMEEYTSSAAWQAFLSSFLEPLNDMNEKRQLGQPTTHGGGSPSDDDDELPAHPAEDLGEVASQFEFRSPDQHEQLFDHDQGWAADDELIAQELDDGDHEMELDAEPAEDRDSLELSASVNAMHVDAGREDDKPQEDPKPKEDVEEAADAAEYNDINFWKPRPTWFKKE